ncbi:hypothetical protein C6569_00635 [Phreatobacter cathodiphilus]|uniref:Lysozyme inhibitor LprI N-terminal domain-containing protein n=2 Tax=Phreatobacter cathodiphilus TaxID=1868589 RepID=A0A2S0N6Z0_9HYPH|nr:hypothetical protein C6569_00635 [Phreatobacter cathodiphilus]
MRMTFIRTSAVAMALAIGLHAGGGTALAQEIGIPECDRFITSYEVCVTTKVPATHRVTFSQQVAQLRTTWRSLAQDPQTRQQLEAICRTQGEQMRRGLEPFGCAF